ncbi:MAG: TIGR04255 family protein [Gammaproteobacteria bacterium]
MMKLPTKLKKEPLIDAVFELRFTSVVPASSILPGILFSQLNGDKSIERLGAADLPKQVRDADPNLQYAPIIRINWGSFLIFISDRSVAVACKLPYVGWSAFKPAIIEVVRLLKDVGIIKSVQRYALKYVDLLPALDAKDQVSLLNIEISLGNHKLEKEIFQVRVEIPKDGFTHAVQVASSAEATMLDGVKKEGIIVDIDTAKNIDNEGLDGFLENLPYKLDAIHATNKAMFFDCLKPETIIALEPVYD